jgi:hypothetical protein
MLDEQARDLLDWIAGPGAVSGARIRRGFAMINPEMICSVAEVAGGWQVFQCGLPAEDRVHATRDGASARARYLNGVEEQYYPVLSRVAQIVDALRRRHGIRREDGQHLVLRALQSVGEADDRDLAAFADGRPLQHAG